MLGVLGMGDGFGVRRGLGGLRGDVGCLGVEYEGYGGECEWGRRELVGLGVWVRLVRL